MPTESCRVLHEGGGQGEDKGGGGETEHRGGETENRAGEGTPREVPRLRANRWGTLVNRGGSPVLGEACRRPGRT